MWLMLYRGIRPWRWLLAGVLLIIVIIFYIVSRDDPVQYFRRQPRCSGYSTLSERPSCYKDIMYNGTVNLPVFQRIWSVDRGYVYSAFIDDRAARDSVALTAGPATVVRVLAWFPRNAEVACRWRCLFWFNSEDLPVEGPVLGWSNLNHYDYSSVIVQAMLICQLPNIDPRQVGLPTIRAVSIITAYCEQPQNFLVPVDLRLERLHRLSEPIMDAAVMSEIAVNYDDEFSICVPPLFGSVSVVDLVEFIEVNMMFGATKFHFYIESVSKDVDTLLSRYANRHIVELHPWPIPADILATIHYHGQILSMNDCGYRAVYRSKYLLLQDFDEFVVPMTADNLTSMLDQYHSGRSSHPNRIASFLFQHRFFPMEFPDTEQLPSDLQKYQFKTLRKTTADHRLMHDERTKTMSRPERVFTWHVHSVLDQDLVRREDRNIIVPAELAQLNHYRDGLNGVSQSE